MGGLPPGVGVVLERVGEVRDALEPLGIGGREADGGHGEHREAEAEQAHRRPDHPEHAEQDRGQHHRGPEVATDQDQRDDGEEAGHDRHEQVVQLAQAALLVRVDVGRPEHHRELGHLGRLHGERTDRQPVLVAVDVDAEAGDQREEHEGEQEAGIGQPADLADRQPGGDPGTGQADRHPHQLALHHGVGVVVDQVGAHARGAQHHDQADGEQQPRCAEQQVVGRERPVDGLAQRAPHGCDGGEQRPQRRPQPAPGPGHARSQRRPDAGRLGVLGVRGGHRLSRSPRIGLLVGRVVSRCRRSVRARPRRTHRRGRRSWRTCPWRRTPAPAERCPRTWRARRQRRRRAPSGHQSRRPPHR
ncbi:hypothetical protein NOZE110980_19950 [Nocardioides zeicaulis]